MTKDARMIEQAFSLVAAACERIQDCGKCDECPKKHTCICGDTNVMDMAELISALSWDEFLEYADHTYPSEDDVIADYADRARKE